MEARAYWLGRVPYREAWDLQRAIVPAVRSGDHPGALLLLEHPHVFTIGRRGDGSTLLWGEAEREAHGVELVWTDRGGDATYHGPGQLVGYPILALPRLGSDVIRFIRAMEQSLIAQLAGLGIASEPGGKSMTGVWSGGAKVAAIGIKLNRGHVTSHGFALNLTTDLEIFNQGIVPCGLVGRRATSVLELGGPCLETAEAAERYIGHFGGAYELEMSWADPAPLWSLPLPEEDTSTTAGPVLATH